MKKKDSRKEKEVWEGGEWWKGGLGCERARPAGKLFRRNYLTIKLIIQQLCSIITAV